MRDIRFRAKRKDNNQWIYGYLYVDSFGLGETSYFIINFQTTDIFPGKIPEGMMPVHPETLGQFTNLKDKNGKDIFEGDKLRIYYRKKDDLDNWVIGHTDYIVEYDESKAAFKPEYYFQKPRLFTLYGADILCGRYQMEVIGNIHDMEKEEKE